MSQRTLLFLDATAGSLAAKQLAATLQTDLGLEIKSCGIMDAGLADSADQVHCEGCACGASAVVLCCSPDLLSQILQLIGKCRRVLFIVAVTEICEPSLLGKVFKAGAGELLLPPFDPSHVLPRLRNCLDSWPYEDIRVDRLKEKLGIRGFIGKSPAFLAEIAKIPLIARCDATILISGETGTGKEVCARAIHHLGSRSNMPFVPLNCGAIPGDLVENELFGHEQGAFTGATAPSLGLVQEAEGGTLFLDEIDSLPLGAQVKLLRFLQDGEFRRVGSRKTCNADVRVIAAGNGHFDRLIAQGKLRLDLYYRLITLRLSLPPLRARSGDISLLANHFLHKFAGQFNNPTPRLSLEALHHLISYDWPGNVRELEHVIKHAILMAETLTLEPKHLELPWISTNGANKSFQELKRESIRQFERRFLTEYLCAFDGNVSQAAQGAKKNRRAFFELMRKHHIERTSFTGGQTSKVDANAAA